MSDLDTHSFIQPTFTGQPTKDQAVKITVQRGVVAFIFQPLKHEQLCNGWHKKKKHKKTSHLETKIFFIKI